MSAKPRTTKGVVRKETSSKNATRKTEKKYTHAQLAGREPFLSETHLENDVWTKALKWFFAIFNYLLMLGSLVVIGLLAAWIYTYHTIFSDLKYLNIMIAWYIVLSVGFLAIVMAFMGIVGSILENRVVLFLYSILLTFIALCSVSGGITAIVFSSSIRTELELAVKQYVEEIYTGMSQQPYDLAWSKIVSAEFMMEDCCSFIGKSVQSTSNLEVVKYWHGSSMKWAKKQRSIMDEKENVNNPSKTYPLVPRELCCVEGNPCPVLTREKWISKDYEEHARNLSATKMILGKTCSGAIFSGSTVIYILIGVFAAAILLLMALLVMAAVSLYRSVMLVECYFQPVAEMSSSPRRPSQRSQQRGTSRSGQSRSRSTNRGTSGSSAARTSGSARQRKGRSGTQRKAGSGTSSRAGSNRQREAQSNRSTARSSKSQTTGQSRAQSRSGQSGASSRKGQGSSRQSGTSSRQRQGSSQPSQVSTRPSNSER